MPPRLSQSELLRRTHWRCEHGHTGLPYDHGACYDKQFPNGERIGFFDIESEDLSAEYGIIFCYCIRDSLTGKFYEDHTTLDDIRKYSSKNREKQPREDYRVVKNLIRDFRNFSRLVGHYSSRYDLPFIRSRACINNLDFMPFGSIYQSDTWDILRRKFKFRRNTLENSHLQLFGFSRKDRLSLSIKHGCLRGERWAIRLTRSHCRKDVLDTEEVYNKIYNFVKHGRTSI